MKTIYKYILHVSPSSIIVPKGAQLLSMQVQRDQVCAWFLIDPNEKEKEVKLYLPVMTGETVDLPLNAHFLTTLQFDGSLVYHIFELK